MPKTKYHTDKTGNYKASKCCCVISLDLIWLDFFSRQNKVSSFKQRVMERANKPQVPRMPNNHRHHGKGDTIGCAPSMASILKKF